ncbi:hypothetical protein [Deinococcus sp. RM]|uniref:hypothetical protein n=1 Tax=Deinococcus sp. RM TaxID=2316359 RepID=UPI0011C22A28|nr:hypothetical protein [Deinococcus sp. RM]
MQINHLFGYASALLLLLGAVYFVQALLKREGAWRRFAITAALYVVASSLAYFLTTPQERAELAAKRAAAEQKK